MPGVFIRTNDAVSHFKATKQLLVRGHKILEAMEIAFADRSRGYDAPRAGFEVLEHFRFGKWKLEFVAVQDLENNDFMALKPELLESQRDFFGRLQQIGKEKNHAAPMDQPDGVLQKPREAGPARGAQ